MQEIIKGLWLGDENDAAKAAGRGYSILSACKDSPTGYSHRGMLQYESLGAPKGGDYLFKQKGHWMALNLIDVDDPDMIPDKVLDAGLNFLRQETKSGKKIFVHCNAGKSRSATIVLMYLKAIGELQSDFIRSEKIFKALYPEYEPNAGMRHHARKRWNALPSFFKEK
jgi:hypothetical protein